MARIKYYDPGTNEWKYADSNIIRGGIDYYEQPEAPESAPVGSLWYDTDEEATEAPAPGGDVDFQTDETLTLKNGILSVNTTNDMEQDNTLPITSAGVFATVGNIEALLKTI